MMINPKKVLTILRHYHALPMTTAIAAGCLVLFCGQCSQSEDDAPTAPGSSISLEGFNDVIKHWRDQHPGEDGRLYKQSDVVGIANNLLLYQRDNGGWPTNKNPLLIVEPEQSAEILHDKSLVDTSLDNRNTYPQIRYLAHAYQQTRDRRYQTAVIEGLRYLLDTQYPNGGWAHSPPSAQGYRSHITIADEVMPGVLTLLREVATEEYPFDFLDPALVQDVAAAWKKGENLLLDLQVVIDGTPTIWAGQYEKQSLEPVDARSYELAGLQTWESVAVVRYLMADSNPNRRFFDAVNNAVEWLEMAQIRNLRIEKIPTDPVRFRYHTSTYDLLEIADENAPPIWARFYDLKTQKPFFANRDGIKVYKLQDVKRERRTGYDWYGSWPQSLIAEDYSAWKKRCKLQ